jgi:hypothetical protein
MQPSPMAEMALVEFPSILFCMILYFLGGKKVPMNP